MDQCEEPRKENGVKEWFYLLIRNNRKGKEIFFPKNLLFTEDFPVYNGTNS